MTTITISSLILSALSPNYNAANFPWGGPDFVQYYVALELVFAGQNPYDHRLAAARQSDYGLAGPVQTYAPPWGLLPSFLVIWFPFTLACYLNVALNIALLILCAACWILLLFPARYHFLPLALIGPLLWLPCLEELKWGQIAIWPLTGFTGWLWFTCKRQSVPAGLFLALTIIKPHIGLLPAIFAGVYSLRQKDWRTVAAFIFGFVTLTGITLCLRPTIWVEYVTAIRNGMPPTEVLSPTLNGVGRWYLGPFFVYFSYPLWAITLLGVALTTWKRFIPAPVHIRERERKGQVEVLVAWSVIITMLAIPVVCYAWLHDFIFLLPGYLLALGRWLENKPAGRFALVVWVALDVLLRLSHYGDLRYWIVPWIGLGLTIWLLRDRLIEKRAGDIEYN